MQIIVNTFFDIFYFIIIFIFSIPLYQAGYSVRLSVSLVCTVIE